jgi:hypothetical protein
MMTVNRRTFCRFGLGCPCAALAGLFSAQGWAQTRPYRHPDRIGDLAVPDTPLAKAAGELSWTECPEFLFNHCMRSFAFASLYARQRNWTVHGPEDSGYDPEVIFIAAALHDLGLLPKYRRFDRTFEEAGAIAAQQFLAERQFHPKGTHEVSEGIRLHAGQAEGQVPSIALIMYGTAIDVFGANGHLPKGDQSPADKTFIDAALAAFRRLDFKRAFTAQLTRHLEYLRANGASGIDPWIPDAIQGILASPWPE